MFSKTKLRTKLFYESLMVQPQGVRNYDKHPQT